MLNKYLKIFICCVGVSTLGVADAASSSANKKYQKAPEQSYDKYQYGSNKKQQGCDKSQGCDPNCSWINKPLPPYTAPETPNCSGYPPRPYALPMQGIKYMWTFGADLFWMYLEPKNSFSEIFRSEKIGGTMYLAQRFRNPFGYELGLSYTDRKPKTLQTVPGTVAWNTVATATAQDTGRVRIKIAYADLQAHTRLCKYIESKFIVGIGWVRQGLEYTYTPVNTTDPVQNAMRAMEGRTAWTMRLGVGAQALITDRIGCRAIIMYQNMSQIEFRNMPYGTNQHPFHDSLTGSIGLYWTFLPLADPHNIGYE